MELMALKHENPLIKQTVENQWQALLEQADSPQKELLVGAESVLANHALQQQLVRCWGGSDYVADSCVRSPQLLISVLESGDLQRRYEQGEYQRRLADKMSAVETEDELARVLRQFRMREQVRIIWRDLNRLASLEETTSDLSAMADACIELAYRWLYPFCSKAWGVPMATDGTNQVPQHLVVLGMGKLGACELNLSSDIDLIFAYPSQGETVGGRRSLANQEFFIRLGQKLIKALDALTVDGFVFRVDMRLRPYGQSGSLVLSFGAMEQYYQDQGRDWERYAMIKARVVAGDQRSGQELLSILKPFVYRRYIDFSAVEALRDMKRMIQGEVKRKGLEENIKLGSGGIREIEFIGQAFQLIHGGRDRALQQRPILGVLTTLQDGGYLPAFAVSELKEAYVFLRNVEHAIQAVADKQTQDLPGSVDGKLRLALALQFSNWDSFYAALSQHRTAVERHFDSVIADPSDEKAEGIEVDVAWSLFWSAELTTDESVKLFEQAGSAESEASAALMIQLRDGRALQSVQRQGRERIDLFMPLLLSRLAEQPDPDVLLRRLLPLVEAVMRRTSYLVLLMENRSALEQLLRLFAASPWIADKIARFPMLLDEFLDVDSLFSPPGRQQLADELRQQMMRIPEDDLEQQMEALRYFKTAHVLRVAAAEIAGTLPLMKVSDYLTWIAEVVLCEVVDIAWANMVARHGNPQSESGVPAERDFVVIGYGKMGGIELGYGSDLDLVFVHDVEGNVGTDGKRSIDNTTFFTRLGQRIIHILNTQTTSGQLYEVDMRLRPSGASGLLVSSLASFSAYQQTGAWTWEHQALCRGRVVAGSDALAQRFESVRAQVLGRDREIEKLRQEVVDMRQKMRDNLGTTETNAGAEDVSWQADAKFNLKQDQGGIVDIEFMVQYAVLAWAQQTPELLRFSDNIRVLESLETSGLLSSQDAELLREAYKAYRAAVHRLALQNQKAVVGGDSFHEFRRGVIDVWQRLMVAAVN